MFSIIQALFAFIFVIIILVTVHEFGHYWVAKKLGIKILRFSVGFGKPLWSRKFGQDQTEFCLAPIPFGGYVSMLDEREGDVSSEELHRAFNRQSLKVRAAVVFAGPLFNLIFAVFVYAAMYMLGITGMKAIVGDVELESIAARAGFQSGYQIVAVDEQPTLRWDSVAQATLNGLIDKQTQLKYTVQDERTYQYTLNLNISQLSLDDVARGSLFEKLGIMPLGIMDLLPAKVGKVVPDSPAERDGLQVGDHIVVQDGQAVKNWDAWATYISQNPEKAIETEIERNGQRVTLILTPERTEDGKGRMGIYVEGKYQVPDEYLTTEHYGPVSALGMGVSKTWEMSELTLRLIWKMLTLQVSPKHISGPITIGEIAGKVTQKGIISFLMFLGLISVSLGILNLLPIPVLDGGHLFMFGIEAIKGSPLKEASELFLQRIGLTLLLALMGLAIYNDLFRLFFE